MYILSNPSFTEQKIGCSIDPDMRIAELQTSVPEDFDKVLLLYSDNYIALEKQLHDMFYHKHKNREFYNLNSEDLANILMMYGEYVVYYDLPCSNTKRPSRKKSFNEVLEDVFKYPGEEIPTRILYRKLSHAGYRRDEIELLLQRADHDGVLLCNLADDTWKLCATNFIFPRSNIEGGGSEWL